MSYRKVIVCGGRDYTNRGYVFSMLVKPPIPFDLMIVGGCLSGVDEFARVWAVRDEVPHLVVPARWRKLGNSAGPIRNAQMLDIVGEVDAVLAFPGGSGTADMCVKAKKAGVQVWRALGKEDWQEEKQEARDGD